MPRPKGTAGDPGSARPHKPGKAGATPAPATLTDEQRIKGTAVCDLMAQGHTLGQACDAEKVDRRRIWEWRGIDPAFDAYFERCFQLRLDFIANELLDIADDGRNDWVEIESKKGNSYAKPNDEVVRRSQLRIDTRLRILRAYGRQQWGDKLDVTSGGKPVGQLAAALIEVGQELEQPEPAQRSH